MIVAAAFCPHPPLLVPAVAGAAAGDLNALREACDVAITRVRDSGVERLVLLGSGEVSASHSPVARGSLAGYGVPVDVWLGSPACGGTVELPLSLTVAAWLLGQSLGPRTGAVGFSAGPDFPASRAALELLALAESADVGLIVSGDGTACRSTRAPGYLDKRAEPFDAAIEAALRDGDGDALARLDQRLGAELLVAGVPAWRAAGGLLAGGTYDAQLLYSGAPYGVAYFAAVWTARD